MCDKILVGMEESAEAVTQKCSVNKGFGTKHVNFTGNYMCLSLFLIKFQALRPATLTNCFYHLKSFFKRQEEV